LNFKKRAYMREQNKDKGKMNEKRNGKLINEENEG
jgi:hypothetical protein